MSKIIVAPCFWLDADGIEREIANRVSDRVVLASCEEIRRCYPHIQVKAIRFHGFSKEIICPANNDKLREVRNERI